MLKLSNIQKIDFNKLYMEQKSLSTFKLKSAEDWDEKASYMSQRVFESIYIKEFLQKIDLDGANTLLDVGCGPGTLGVSLAPKLKDVYCLDFSSKMLQCVKENAKNRDLANIKTMQKSFEDDWSDVPKCDILIASRCMEVVDLQSTLKLLNSKAKKIYITYKVGGSFIDKDILYVIDQNIEPKPDFIYLVNILYQMGIDVNVDFIRSENTRFDAKNSQDFIEKIRWSLGVLEKKDEENLVQFYENSFKNKKRDKYIKWALISYETN